MVSRSDLQGLAAEIEHLREAVRRLTERVYALEQGGSRRSEIHPVEIAQPSGADDRLLSPALTGDSGQAADSDDLPNPGDLPGPGWETVLGGNWLNKVGVLVLVIGLALFLWYSFGRMGPGGRVTVSLAASVVLLASGVILERYDKYRVAARGLIGGGWAALYSTTYAAHAVEAARVVNSPAVATALLSVVAAGMILHSLRYKSQTVTGLAYFAGFVTLAISPLTFFAVVALMPLAGSLLYLTYRFRWPALALAGLPVTYGIYLLHAARTAGGSLAVGQTVLFLYWLVFEAFDLQYAVLVRRASGNPCPVLPLNAFAFLAVSLVQWHASSPDTVHQLFLLSAVAYLTSTMARIVLLPVSGFAPDMNLLERVKGGSYEGSLALAAGLTAVAISLKLTGLSVSLALLAEAELLFLAGLYFKQPFVRHLAAVLLGASVLRMLVADVPRSGRIELLNSEWRRWSPVALLDVAAFYVNRFLDRGTFYGHGAAAMLMLVMGAEIRFGFVGLAWLSLAIVLHEIGFREQLRDFRIQGYWVGAVGLMVLLLRNVLAGPTPADWHEWAPLLGSGILLYATALRRQLPARLLDVASVSGTVLIAAFLSKVLTSSVTTVGWGAQGVLLLLAGFFVGERRMRLSGLGLLLVCVGKLFGYDLRHLDLPFRILSFLVLGVILIGVSFAYSRYRERISRYLN